MTDLAALTLAIDSRPALDAASALDRLTTSADRTENATDGLIAALNRNASATSALSAVLSQIEASGGRARTALAGVGAASVSAADNVVRLTTATTATRAGFDAAAASAAKLRSAWADLGAQGASTLANVERMQKLATSSAITPGFSPNVPSAANANGRLRPDQVQNLAYQASDVFTQAASGGSPFLIAAQQGPQIAQSFMGPGAGSIRGAFAQAGEAATGLVARVGLVSGALGGLSIAAGVGVTAVMAYQSAQKQTEQSLLGIGRASGATVGSINTAARAYASAGGVSVSSARDMANEFAATGKIGDAMFGGLITAARDFASTTGTDVPTATQQLAAAFADPAKGAEALNTRLGFLDATTRENIQAMAESGNRLGAQKALLDALTGSLVSADSRLGFFSRQWSEFARNTSNEFEGIGRAIDKVLTGGDLEARLATAQKVLDASKARESYLPFGIGARDSALAQGEVDRLSAELSRLRTASRTTDLASRSTAVDSLVKQLNPEAERADQLARKAASIRQDLAAGVLDPEGRSLRTAQGLEASALRIRQDLAAGGSAIADSLARAVHDSGQIGRTGFGRSASDINFEYEQRRKQVELQNPNPADREVALANLQREQNVRLQTAQREATAAEVSRSGLFNMVPPNLRQAVLDAQRETGVPLDFGLAVMRRESSMNPFADANKNDPRSHAYGLMQLQPGTARELGVDPRDPAQNILGGFRYLRQGLDANNQDPAAAYRYYHDGPGATAMSPAARKAFGDIQRYMNTPTTSQVVAGEDDRSRQLDVERQRTSITAELYGKNGEAYDAATRKLDLMNQALARGEPITAEMTTGIDTFATAMARNARALAGTRAGVDLSFERDQLGRDRYDQQAFSRARGYFNDVTSPQATTYVEQARQLSVMSDARSTFSDSMSGFVTALSHGTSAADAASSALGRFGDKLISGAIDSLTGSLFKSVGGAAGGGDFLGGIGKLFGFADGGVMSSGGPLPLHRYATGGIASSPQLALFGEGRGPEAFVPLPDGRSIPVQMRGGGLQGWGGSAAGAASGNGAASQPAQVTNHFDLRGSTLTRGEVQAALTQAIQANNTERDRTSQERGELLRRAAF